MKKELIRLTNVGFAYESEEEKSSAEDVLQNVSFTLCEGEYVAIVGHNGSGKSTLAKLLNLILQPTKGEIVIDGISVTNATLSDADILKIRKNVGMIFQNPDNQLVATLVEEDVAFGPENLGLSREEIGERVRWALETVGMTAYANHSPHKLSGGQKQRIAIAGVLAMKPSCIIFDESTAMLDPKGRKDILATMDRLHREEGIAILHITHHMNEAVLADRVLVLDDGLLKMDGTPEEVFASVEQIFDMGLEVPQGAELVARLRKLGYPVEGKCLRVEDSIDTLLHFVKGGNNE